MSAPTRFKNGVTTAPQGAAFGMFGLPDGTDTALALYDFQQFVAADWTVTNTSSHNTIGLVAASSTVPAGGVLGIVGGGSTVANDIGAVQATPANFYFTSAQNVWFKTALRLDVAANNQVIAGLASSVATAAPTDGIYFSKAAGAATVDLVVRKGSTSTTQSAVATLSDATGVELAFHYNGKDAVNVFVNDVKVASVTTLTNLPTATALAPCLCLKVAATAPTTAYAYVDYISASQDRTL